MFTSPVWQAKKINSYILKNLDKVKIPSIALLAERDRVVDNIKTRKTLTKFAKRPEIIEYPDSEHVIYFGPSKGQLISDVIDFIKRI